jgi:YD repeat-containing protein
VYSGSYRWGYEDTDKDAVKDVTETKVQSVAEFDNNGDYISITSYKDDGTTIETVTTFDWPATGYQVTRIVNEPAGKDTIQVSNADNDLVAIMTLAASWGDYADPDDVQSSTVYTYNTVVDLTYRVGYVDENKNALKDASESKLDSIAAFDVNGDVVSVTGYLADGTTMEYIVEYDEPQAGWSSTRSLNSPFGRDTIQIADNDGQLRGIQTTKASLLDNEAQANTIIESTVFEYDGTSRWGYVDTDLDGIHDTGETLLDNKVLFDANGDVISATYFDEDGTTISRIDVYNSEFGTPNPGYITTTIFNYPADGTTTVQLTNPDGNLIKKREIESGGTITYFLYEYPTANLRNGWIDADNNGTINTPTDKKESEAFFDDNGNMTEMRTFFTSGTYSGEYETIQLFAYDGTRTIQENRVGSGAADGDYRILYIDIDNNVTMIAFHDISADRIIEDYYNTSGTRYQRIIKVRSTGEVLSVEVFGVQTLPDGRTRVEKDDGSVEVYDADGVLVEETDNQKIITIYEWWDTTSNIKRVETSLGIIQNFDSNGNLTGTTSGVLNSITTFEYEYPLGRGNDWELMEIETWTDGIVVKRNYATQDIIEVRLYERETNGDLISESIIYQHEEKNRTTVEMNWPISGWRAARTPGLDGANDVILIVDERNNKRGYMLVSNNTDYHNPANVVLSVVYAVDGDHNPTGYGYVDTNKDGVQQAGETTVYSFTETWSVNTSREVTRIYNAGGDVIEIRDATYNGKIRAEMVLTGTGSSFDYNNPAHVASSVVYKYERDGSWTKYTDVNKNGLYDAGTDTSTGITGQPDYRTHDGALSREFDNEGNILSTTYGSGMVTQNIFDNDGVLVGIRESRHNGTIIMFDNDGLRTEVTTFDGNLSIYTPGGLYPHTEFMEYATNGAYVGVINERDSNGNLISQTDNEGNILYMVDTGSRSFNINNNGYSVSRFEPGDGYADAQILTGGEFRTYHSTGTVNTLVKKDQTIFGGGVPDAMVTRWSDSGSFISQTDKNGGILANDFNGQMQQFHEADGANYMVVFAGSDTYYYLTQMASNIVLLNGSTSVPITVVGSATNTVSTTTVYQWTEGSNTVFRWNGINRYFNASGKLIQTKTINSTGTVLRTINYGDEVSAGSGVYTINSIVDQDSSSMTLTRSAGVVTGISVQVGTGTTITTDSTGQALSVNDYSHIQTYDASGNLTSMTTADSRTRAYAAVGSDTVITGSGGFTQVLNANGNVTSITDGKGNIATYSYVSNSIYSTSISLANGSTRFYELFNGKLRLSQVTDESGRTTDYYYDTNGYLDKYIITDDGVRYEYWFFFFDNGTEIIHASYLMSITDPGYLTMTFQRDATYPYRVLSRSLQLNLTVGTNNSTLYLTFFGSSKIIGSDNFREGDLEYISGSRFGTEYAIKTP